MAKRLSKAERIHRNRSEAAKKAWRKRYRKMGIVPPSEVAKRNERMEATERARKANRRGLLDRAELHAYATLAGMPRFKSTNIRDRFETLSNVRLAQIPNIGLREWVQLARRKPGPSGINPFWYRG